SGSGFWIASVPPSSLACAEASESPDLNLVAGSQGTDDAVKYGANDDVGLPPGHLNGLIQLLGQIGPSHLAHPLFITKKEYHSVPWHLRTPTAPRWSDTRTSSDAAPLEARSK